MNKKEKIITIIEEKKKRVYICDDSLELMIPIAVFTVFTTLNLIFGGTVAMSLATCMVTNWIVMLVSLFYVKTETKTIEVEKKVRVKGL